MSDSLVVVRIRRVESGHATTVQCNHEAQLEDRFVFDRRPGTEADNKIRNIEDGVCSLDDIRYVGALLWNALLPGALLEKVQATIQGSDHTLIRLEIPEELEELPWETSYDDALHFIACQSKITLFHSTHRQTSNRPPTRLAGLSVLLVIPAGSGLNVETERANLRQAVAKLGDAVKIQDLRGAVTPDRLRAELGRQPWHVVAFIGHGRVNDNYVEIRLNDDQGGEHWCNSEALAAMFQGSNVDACILNCCHGGSATDVRRMDRLAPALMDAGVRSVVAMRYPMDDIDANRFALAFYERLFDQPRAGRIGYAAQLARISLLSNKRAESVRGFITPLVHVAGADDLVFELPKPERVPIRVQAATPPLQLPRELIEAMRAQRCVPVVGTELIPPPTERRGPVAASLRVLVEKLAQQLKDDPELADDAADDSYQNKPVDQQLGRLAERYEAKDAWEKLMATLSDFFGQQKPTDVHRSIASWPVLRIFYTHFDGLMEAAFALKARVTANLTEAPETVGVGSADALLVLVRGSVRERPSLVIGEHDHFALSSRIERMHPSILSLARSSSGYRTLFLGTTPGDRITRELGLKLLQGDSRRAPTSYFVTPDHAPGDELFWRRFRVEFIRAEADAFVRALTNAQVEP